MGIEKAELLQQKKYRRAEILKNNKPPEKQSTFGVGKSFLCYNRPYFLIASIQFLLSVNQTSFQSDASRKKL